MNNRISKLIAITTLSLVATFSQATLISSSVDIVHDYGNAAGKYSPNSLNSSNTCDSLTANAVNITDTSSGCGRFYDYFDFSATDFVSIDSLELKLNFSGNTDISSWWFFSSTENWDVRPGASASLNSGYDYDHDVDITSNLMTFNSSNLGSTIFDNMLNNERFSLMFSEITSNSFYGTRDFNLFDATLIVNGQIEAITEVPEPAPLALFSLSLLALGLVKKRKK